MSDLRSIRTRIKSIKNIQQITRAMKMVASARLNKAQRQLLDTRPYALQLAAMLGRLSAHEHEFEHPLLTKHPKGRTALVVLTSDKGLCGGFNAQPLQNAARRIQTAGADPVDVLVAGRKGIDFFRRTGIRSFREWTGFWQDLNWYHADNAGQELIDVFSTGRWERLVLVYNRFKSLLVQETVVQELLPVPLPAEAEANLRRPYEFEPSAEGVLEHLLPRYVKMSFWHALLESKAAELAARMQAMGNATESAGDMIADLTLHMNRARQAAITREISELVGSAEAINA